MALLTFRLLLLLLLPPPLASTTNTQDFRFYQTHNGNKLDSITAAQFLAAPFSELCPSTDCIKDCHNWTRIFQAVPDGVNATVHSYGQPDPSGKVHITVFGLCTNLVSANQLARAQDNGSVKKFFPEKSYESAVDNVFKQVALNITGCLGDTCSKMRNPDGCGVVCDTTSLLNDNTNKFDWRRAMLGCTRRLCGATNALPYANQDIFGIGVLVSYCIQGLLLLAAALGVIVTLAWRLWNGKDARPRTIGKFKDPLATFLTAETYFSISAAIAAFIMNPLVIDPLNGYALMTAAVVDFLCPVFTLLLLRSLDVRTRFGTSLTFMSWLLNSVIFLMLLKNLSSFDDTVTEDALKQLFSVPSCGDSSAMALCQQLTGHTPLERLTEFFEGGSWTSIKTVPVIWAWTTFALFALLLEEGWRAVRRPRGEGRARAQRSVINASLGQPEARQPRGWLSAEYLRLGKFAVVALLVALFTVSFGYGFSMVLGFHALGVIDTHGWSFGQVVAAIFWAPVFLDIAHSIFSQKTLQFYDSTGIRLTRLPTVEKKQHAASNDSSKEGLELERMPSAGRSSYTPSPEPDLTNLENPERHLHSASTAPPSLGPRKRSMHKRQTFRMEEGQEGLD